MVLAILLTACSSSAPAESQASPKVPMLLSSPAFAAGEQIPAKYTCTGNDISPELNWADAPQRTQSFALIMDDLDAPMGTWVHWVIFNIPADAHQLPEAFGQDKELANGTRQGKNSALAYGYLGPCPPSGTHHYYFELYALDTTLDLAAGAKKDQLLKAMDGHVLAQAEIMGTFSK
jgi:hypothetical protein